MVGANAEKQPGNVWAIAVEVYNTNREAGREASYEADRFTGDSSALDFIVADPPYF